MPLEDGIEYWRRRADQLAVLVGLLYTILGAVADTRDWVRVGGNTFWLFNADTRRRLHHARRWAAELMEAAGLPHDELGQITRTLPIIRPDLEDPLQRETFRRAGIPVPVPRPPRGQHIAEEELEEDKPTE
jgi:hypothetical protein